MYSTINTYRSETHSADLAAYAAECRIARSTERRQAARVARPLVAAHQAALAVVAVVTPARRHRRAARLTF